MTWLFECFRMIWWAIIAVVAGLVVVTIWERIVSWPWRDK